MYIGFSYKYAIYRWKTVLPFHTTDWDEFGEADWAKEFDITYFDVRDYCRSIIEKGYYKKEGEEEGVNF